MAINQTSRIPWLIVLFSALFFIPFLGGSHLFDWDEVNFAEAAREMIETGDYFRVHIDYQPFWEKPPLFFWLQVMSMKAFGVNEFAARLPNALCGILTLLILFRIGKRHFSERFGLIWAMAFGGSLLPFLYFKSGIIDPWFNLFIFLGLYHAIRYRWLQDGIEVLGKPIKHLLFAGLFAGLAVLTKGPAALLILGLCFLADMAFRKGNPAIKWKHIPIYIGVILATMFIWFGPEIILNGSWFIEEFTRYQIRLAGTEDAGHGGFFGYHFVVVFFGCFPASIFAVAGLTRKANEGILEKSMWRWMVILLAAVLILFSIIETKIPHYSSLAYFPVSFLAAFWAEKSLKEETVKTWIRVMFLAVAIIFIVLMIMIPVLMNRPETLQKMMEDPFAEAGLLLDVSWPIILSLVALPLAVGALAWFNQSKRAIQPAAYVILFFTMAISIFLTVVTFAPRIEVHMQGPAIEFYEEHKDEDAYITVMGFKSFAHLFYGKKKEGLRPESSDLDWLVNGEIDKPAYFVTRIDRIKKLDFLDQLESLGQKGGFAFFKRVP